MVSHKLLSVMFVTRKWRPAIGGMETYSHRLSEELAKLAEVEVVALPGQSNGQPPSPARLMLFPLTVASRWFARLQIPDILHLGDMALWPLGLLARLSKGRTRLVLSAHGTDVSYHRRGGFRGRFYGSYLRWGARLLGRPTVIANSRATRRVAAETGWSNASVVLLATDMTGPDSTGEHNGRLLFSGRLVERKGCGWFIREVLSKLPAHIALDVAGAVWNDEERAALANPRVRFLGPLDQIRLAAAYREAMCVVVPNIMVVSGEYEGFGLVAPEGAVAGGVVLAARCDGLIDAVVDGETGMLVESGACDAWTAAINNIANWSTAHRRKFIRRAQERARCDYAWDRVARETLQVYAQGLAR